MDSLKASIKKSGQISLQSQRFIHEVQINGVLAIQRRKARETRKKMGFRYDPSQENKNEQKKFIENIKKRQQAKHYKVQSDSTARLQARRFLQKIRSMKLVQLPELSYFSQMIQKSCSKQKKFRKEIDKTSGRKSSLSTKPITKNKSMSMQRQHDFKLPVIQFPQRKHSETTRQCVQFIKLKALLDNYSSAKRTKTQQQD